MPVFAPWILERCREISLVSKDDFQPELLLSLHCLIQGISCLVLVKPGLALYIYVLAKAEKLQYMIEKIYPDSGVELNEFVAKITTK